MKKNAPGHQKTRITLNHVAEDAGVSRSTVSLVLNGGTNLAENTVQRVLGSIQRLGYVYNRAAASLRTNRSSTVGLLVPNIQNPVFAEIAVGAEEKLDRLGKTLFLANTGESLDRQRRALTLMREHGAEGIMICPVRGTGSGDLALVRGGMPAVFITRYTDDFPCSYVGIDNAGGVAAAMDHLFKLGHTRIAFVGGQAGSTAFRDRSQAVAAALRERGLPVGPESIVPANISSEGGEHAAHAILALRERPSAVICFNDLVALGFVSALKSRGIRPGREISVIGFDDMFAAAAFQPSLTTVHADNVSIGRNAALMLERLIEEGDSEPRRVILPTGLVVRESTGPYRET